MRKAVVIALLLSLSIAWAARKDTADQDSQQQMNELDSQFFASEGEGSGDEESEIPPENPPPEENNNNNNGDGNGNEEGATLRCPVSSTDLESKVNRMIEEDFPQDIHLPVYSRGSIPRLDLTNGMLYVKENRLDNQPYCVERTDGTLRYDFKAEMLDLAGSYQWSVHNFLRRNFSDAVVISARRVRAQFFFSGSPRGRRSSPTELNKLEDVKVEAVDELDVQVTMPTQLTTSSTFNRFLAYLASRISTYVANRSRAAIGNTIQNAIKNSIIAHMQTIHADHVPNLV